MNTEEDRQLYMAKAFDPEKIREEIQDSAVNTFLLAMNGEEAIGYAKLRRDRTHTGIGDGSAIEIERIYAFKSHHGLGAGKSLMDECMRIASEENHRWIWLGVNIDNHRAIAFYKKYGFEIFGSKNFVLGNAVDEDFLMKREV
ncbi:MAG: GNAT family N-acetyltransferase [Bacteroidetes bacterium]|nr:MAG: GNAT family N-acetyltransferase [Bacteroidota bacterium]